METAHTGNTPDQSDINGCQVFINIKKFKMFKIRKDYLMNYFRSILVFMVYTLKQKKSSLTRSPILSQASLK